MTGLDDNILPNILGSYLLSYRVVTYVSMCSKEINLMARWSMRLLRNYIIMASECVARRPALYPQHPYTWPTVVVVFDFRSTFGRWYEVCFDLASIKFSTLRLHLVQVVTGESSVIMDGLDYLCHSLGEHRLRSMKIVLYFPSRCRRDTLFSIAHHILHSHSTCVECVWRKATWTRRAIENWCKVY